jgi:hypothetical protein
LTSGTKARPRRSWPPSRRAPRPSGASLPSTYPRLPAAIRSRRRNPQGSPNPSHLGGFNPLPTHPQAGGEGGRRRRRRMEAPEAALPTAKPEPPAGRSQTRGSQARLRPLCFLSFPFPVSSLCFPYLRRRLPRHRVAHLFTDAFTTRSRWTIGEHRVPLLSVVPGRRDMNARRPCALWST